MLATLFSSTVIGCTAHPVTVEVHIASGLPHFSIVGIANHAVTQIKERVRSAIINSGFAFPSRRITVNLSPAELPKQGARFDLPIALGVLIAAGELKPQQLCDYMFFGELALTGKLRSVSGLLPSARAAIKQGKTVITAHSHHDEMQFFCAQRSITARDLGAIVAHLCGKQLLPLVPQKRINTARPRPLIYGSQWHTILGQAAAKRALIVAATGGHNLLFYGPAGSGKTMLAQELINLLPPMSAEETFSSMTLHSLAHQPYAINQPQRPLRQPHHSISKIGLLGGGTMALPGAISLAHNGVLLLDELTEFSRNLLDQLREPLQEAEIRLHRANYAVTYPCQFQLIATLNPSPTGDVENNRSSIDTTLRYLNKLSEPLLERIDMQCDVPKVNARLWQRPPSAKENDAEENDIAGLRQLIKAHRLKQNQRQGCLNANLNTAAVQQIAIAEDVNALLEQAQRQLGLSARVTIKLVKIARTIADLDHQVDIGLAHMSEALQYRGFDRLIARLQDGA
jgi:magnesium chelatase family protein